MLKMAILLLLAPLFFLCSSVSGQESLHISTIYLNGASNMAPLETIGVAVNDENINEVSDNILTAENWLKKHVLSYYPSTNINYIVVTKNQLCNNGNYKNQEEIAKVALDSMKNIHYSLTRWGLETEIKVSVSLSSLYCVHQSHVKTILSFLNDVNSTYTINPPQFTEQVVNLMISELKLDNNFGIFQSEIVNVISPVFKHVKPTSRKLSFIDNLWYTSTPPSPVIEFSTAPEIQPPVMAPASSPSPHYGFALPPCNPHPHPYHAMPPVGGSGGGSMAPPPVMVGNGGGSTAAPPTAVREEALWCVAKPSVPSEKLQEAMDYACGAGGADCVPIRPNGSCFSPDSVVAHASYAFNSYWQKNKKNGGVCGFQGTAMLISSDPSYLHCHYTLG